MPTYVKPGVYVEETLVPTQPIPANGAVSKAAFVGIADRGPTSVTDAGDVIPVATLVRSWSEFQQKFSFGSALPTFKSTVEPNAVDLKYAMKTFFENGGGEAYVVRLVKEDADKAEITFKSNVNVDALKVKANSEGVWGNNVWVTVANSVSAGFFDLTVYYSETADNSGDLTNAFVVERFAQLSMSSSSTRYALNVVSSNYISLEKPVANTSGANPYGLSSGSINNKAKTGTTATLTTASAHLLVPGDVVNISGVGTPFDGEFTLTAGTTGSTLEYTTTAGTVSSTAVSPVGTFVVSELGSAQQLSGGYDGTVAPTSASILGVLDGVDGPLVLNWPNSSGYADLDVNNKALTSNVATLTTAEDHLLSVGDVVVVTGVDSTFNGTFTVTAVPTATTFSYAKTATNVTSAAVSPVGTATVPYSHDDLITEACLLYASERRDVFVVVDPVAGASVSSQIAKINSYDAATRNFGAAYYPQIVVGDPISRVGGTVTIAPGGAVTALYINADEQKGPQQTPAGINARVNPAVSVYSLTNSEYTSVSENEVALNIIRFMPGAGIVVMGGRTMSDDNEDKYISVRRSLQYLTRALTNITQFALFEPNDEVLWGRVRSTIDSFLYGFWNRGGLRGATAAQAYYVKCDSELNTFASVDAGELRVEVGVALQKPAEFVVIKLGQLDGGTSVTTSL